MYMYKSVIMPLKRAVQSSALLVSIESITNGMAKLEHQGESKKPVLISVCY
jgi:hypothetical protein